MPNDGLDEAQADINNLRYADDTTLMAESEEELKHLWWRWKRRLKKSDLNLSIQKMKIMASGPMTSWQIDGEAVETLRDFIFWAPKSLHMVTQPWNWKTHVPWKESYDKLRQHIKKQRHYFANKVPSNQRYGFSSSHVWMWELDHKEGWAPKNDAFVLWCWRRLESLGLQGDPTSPS